MFHRDNGQMDECLATSLAVLDAGWATTDQLRHADAWRRWAHPQLGKLAMKQGKLTMPQVFDILGHQAIADGLFGEIALEMGLLSKADLFELLELQLELTPTMADALMTLGVITPEQGEGLLKRTRPAGDNRHSESEINPLSPVAAECKRGPVAGQHARAAGCIGR
jgi:hypothetical protein